MLVSPWNWVGLGIAVAITSGTLAGVWVVVSKLGFRPLTKPLPSRDVKLLEEQAEAAAEVARREHDELASREKPPEWVP